MIGWGRALCRRTIEPPSRAKEIDMRSLEEWREKRRNQKSYIQLRGLSAHLLADIGIGPDEMDRLRRGEPVRR